jgi:glycosyltransferase involved in cell wall biosynthesis
MRIAFLTSGPLVPSSRYRVLQFLPGLRALGHECLVLPSRPTKYGLLPWPYFGFSSLLRRGNRRRDFETLERWGADVVVLERELFNDATFDAEQSLRRAARRLVLDVDDGLFVARPRKFDALCALSDHVIAGNELLAARARSVTPRVTVIPTCVDLARFGGAATRAAAPSRTRVLGWTGTSWNIPSLETLRRPLAALAREFPLELRVIAESGRRLRRLAFERDGIATRFRRWSEASECADLRAFDIGLMPLPDDAWSRHKCGLKILQYMAAGVPAVASPVGVNAQIIRHGVNGWLAATPEEWTRTLRLLLADPARGAAVLAQARLTVAEGYSVAAHLPRLADCLAAVNNEPGGAVAASGRSRSSR